MVVEEHELAELKVILDRPAVGGLDLSCVVEALTGAVEAKDSDTGQHLYRTTILANACLEQIDIDLARDEEINFGFLLHDVGKIGIPDAVLNKPGPLTDIEWAIMKSHPVVGARIVEPIGFSTLTTDVILLHHEHFDGTGYPERRVKEEIPVAARVFAVADAYDAMTSDRPYREAMPQADALTIIKLAAGTRYDPEIVDVFIDLMV
jgi:HD-GYP domain-containing protein (c-di-GMP phosphodiesterase class II)